MLCEGATPAEKEEGVSSRDAASEQGSRAGHRGQTLRRAWIELALLIVGLAVLARLVAGIGEGAIIRVYELGGPALLLVTAPHLLAVLAITLSWWSVIPRDRRARVGFARLVPAWLAGDALNYLLPAATLGGEPTKVRLVRDVLAVADGTASVTLARVTDLFGLVAFGALGTACAVALRPDASDAMLYGGLAGVTVLTLALAGAARRGLFGGAAGLIRRVRSKSLPFAGAADRVDAEVRRFLRDDRRALATSTAWRTAAWLATVLELWIVFRLLGLHGSLAELTAMAGLIALWNGALFFVPARAGTTEGGWLLVAGLFGIAPEVSLVIALLRRFRDTVWALVGLVALAAFSVRKED